MKVNTTFKDVSIQTYQQEHDKHSSKLMVKFVLNSTEYKNGAIISNNATDEHIEGEHKKLIKWSKTIIKENI